MRLKSSESEKNVGPFYVYSGLQRTEGLQHALKAQDFFHVNEHCFILITNSQIVFYKLDHDQQVWAKLPEEISLVDVLSDTCLVDDCKMYNESGVEKLYILSKGHLTSIFRERDTFIIEKLYANVNVGPTSIQVIETAPILLIDDSNGLAYIHHFPGMINTVSLNGKSKHVTTSFLGSITITHIALLKRSQLDPVIAVVYRDHNFQYSMRYYTLNKKHLFKMSKQFNDFDSIPTGIVALPNGGVMVFTQLHLFYFPDPSVQHISVDDKFIDTYNSIGVNIQEKILTWRLIDSKDPDADIMKLSVFSVVDPNRLVAISSTGMTYMIAYDMQLFSNHSLVIKDFRTIKLGYTTIPHSLSHIYQGYFFASSKASKSVLFTISPGKPFINIIHAHPSSPPILSIEAVNGEIYTCQGNYEHGEFRNVVKAKYDYQFVHKIRRKSAVSPFLQDKVNLLKSENGLDYMTNDGKVFMITTEGLLVNDDMLYQGHIINGTIFGNSMVIVTKESIFSLSLLGKMRESHLFENKARLCSFHKMFTAIVFENKTMSVFENFKCVQSIKLEYEIFSVSIQMIEDLVWIFMGTTEGLLIVYCIDQVTKQLIESKTSNVKVQELPFSIHSTSSRLILYDTTTIHTLLYDPIIEFFVWSLTSMEKNGISNLYCTEDNELLIKYETNDIELYKVDEKAIKECVYYTNSLILKSMNIPGTNYSILLTIRKTIDNDEIVRKSELLLIENQSMIEISSLSLGAVIVTDICWIGDLGLEDNLFTVLLEKTDSQTPIQLFTFKTDKLVQLETSPIQGLDNKNLKYQGIKLLNNDKIQNNQELGDKSFLLFLIIGECNFVVQLTTHLSKFHWDLKSSNLYRQKVYTSECDILDNKIILCDIISGPELFSIDDDYNLVYHENMALKNEYLTLSCCLVHDHYDPQEIEYNTELWCGNNKGYLDRIILNNDSEPIYRSSYDQQINIVERVATSSENDEGLQPNISSARIVFGELNGDLTLVSKLNYENWNLLQQQMQEIIRIMGIQESLQVNMRDIYNWLRYLQQPKTGKKLKEYQRLKRQSRFMQRLVYENASIFK